jgi:hypothetical protein
MQSNSIFWTFPKNSKHTTPNIDPLKYIDWLIEKGYKVLLIGNSNILVKVDSKTNIVTIVDGPDVINKETQLYIKNTSDIHFQKGGKYYVSDDFDKNFITKPDILTSLFWNGKKLTEKIFSENLHMVDLLKGEFLHDNQNEVFLNFNNGIVKITEFNIELLKTNQFGAKFRFDTDIISNLPDIKGFSGNIDLSIPSDETSRFEKFCRLVTSKRKFEVIDSKPEIGDNYFYSDDDFNTLKSAIGYLLSDYKEGGASKMVLFQDRYLDNVSRQGGNGKTLIVNSIMRLRKGVKLSANRCNIKGDKFVFQEVNLGDKIVFLDEIMDQDFIGNLFNEINNFLPVQKKYQDQFRLEGQNLPKMVGCSNYMIWKPQEVSQSRRIYCVEFGDFFKSVTEQGYKLEDYFEGNFIFDNMDETEWNRFFKFMFECVQFYLENGFYNHPNPYYSNQNLLLTMKKYWQMDKMEWVRNYLTKTRITQGHYISVDTAPLRVELYNQFCLDLGLNDFDKRKFDEEKFGKMFYQITNLLGYDYNPTQSHRGKSMNSRKITRKGKSGNPYYVIHVVHSRDSEILISENFNEETVETIDDSTPIYFKSISMVTEMG